MGCDAFLQQVGAFLQAMGILLLYFSIKFDSHEKSDICFPFFTCYGL